VRGAYPASSRNTTTSRRSASTQVKTAEERAQGYALGHARASAQTEHQRGHDPEGGGQEREHDLMHKARQVAAIALVGLVS